MTPRFEVDYKQRLEQRRTASNAVRMPRLGYARYRVYRIKIKDTQYTASGIWGSLSVPSAAKLVVMKNRQAGQSCWLQEFDWMFDNDSINFVKGVLDYDVRWLKPKHVTMLSIKGHRVVLERAL
jgi:hypothetical protein